MNILLNGTFVVLLCYIIRELLILTLFKILALIFAINQQIIYIE